MTRWLLIAVAVTACAKDKGSAPAQGVASSSHGTPPVTAAPPVAAVDPAADEARMKELARNQASLGVSAQTDSFDEPGEGGSNKGTKPKTVPTDDVRRKGEPSTNGPSPSPDGGGGDVPKVGGGTRGDKDKSAHKAQITAVTVDGKAAPAALMTAIRANATKVQLCYDKARETRPVLTGKLVLSFKLVADGTHATVAATSSTLKEPELENCVVAALAGTKLATPLGKADANAAVTIVFKAQ